MIGFIALAVQMATQTFKGGKRNPIVTMFDPFLNASQPRQGGSGSAPAQRLHDTSNNIVKSNLSAQRTAATAQWAMAKHRE
jgi:hypothetical protein